jgi:hypothetical protein
VFTWRVCGRLLRRVAAQERSIIRQLLKRNQASKDEHGDPDED